MNKNVKLDKEKDFNTVEIHSLAHDGRGIATIRNKITFIDGALPNESVTCQITQKRSHYNVGQIVDLIRPVATRVIPPCQHFGTCGGCSLQHMSMEAQLALKEQTLLTQLQHFGQTVPKQVLPPLTAETLGYRRKARLGVKFVHKKDKLLVGFREKSSSYIADLSHCPVLYPAIGEDLSVLSQLIRSLDKYQHIPQIEMAVGDATVALVIRHLAPLENEDREKLIVFAKQHHFQLYLQPNPPDRFVKLWPHDENYYLFYTLPDYQLEFFFHPLDFTQINLTINRMLVKQAVDLLQLCSQDSILDLFCGIGNFTLPMARYGASITGVEGSHEMVTREKYNAVYNGIQNVDFYAANLEKPHGGETWINTSYQKILLDPPRTGAKEILPYLKQFAAKKIVYVSCNPATLARDTKEIVHQHGYTLTQAGIINMFPHTAHIEAIAVFEK